MAKPSTGVHGESFKEGWLYFSVGEDWLYYFEQDTFYWFTKGGSFCTDDAQLEDDESLLPVCFFNIVQAKAVLTGYTSNFSKVECVIVRMLKERGMV